MLHKECLNIELLLWNRNIIYKNIEAEICEILKITRGCDFEENIILGVENLEILLYVLN